MSLTFRKDIRYEGGGGGGGSGSVVVVVEEQTFNVIVFFLYLLSLGDCSISMESVSLPRNLKLN